LHIAAKLSPTKAHSSKSNSSNNDLPMVTSSLKQQIGNWICRGKKCSSESWPNWTCPKCTNVYTILESQALLRIGNGSHFSCRPLIGLQNRRSQTAAMVVLGKTLCLANFSKLVFVIFATLPCWRFLFCQVTFAKSLLSAHWLYHFGNSTF
jgi:hypothetical protein